MDRVYITTINERSVLIGDFSNLTGDEAIPFFEKANELTFDFDGDLYSLADFTNSVASKKALDYLQNEKSKQAAAIYIREAVVGVKGLNRVFLDVYNLVTNSRSRAFDTREQALRWLTGAMKKVH